MHIVCVVTLNLFSDRTYRTYRRCFFYKPANTPEFESCPSLLSKSPASLRCMGVGVIAWRFVCVGGECLRGGSCVWVGVCLRGDVCGEGYFGGVGVRKGRVSQRDGCVTWLQAGGGRDGCGKWLQAGAREGLARTRASARAHSLALSLSPPPFLPPFLPSSLSHSSGTCRRSSEPRTAFWPWV